MDVACVLVCSTPDEMDFYDSVEAALTALRTHGSAHVAAFKRIKIERECAKLLHNRNLPRDAIENLMTSCVQFADVSMSNGCVSDLNARSIVSLVTWLQPDSKLLASLASQVLTNLQPLVLQIPLTFPFTVSCFVMNADQS